MIKWLGNHVVDFIARFRNDVYLENLPTTTETNVLVVDSDGKVSKSTTVAGDITSIDAGTGLSGTSLTGPIPTINIDTAQPTVTSLGTLTALTGGTGDLIWNTNTLVVDTSEAKVGIGTTSPGYKLDVNGEILADGLRLNLSDTVQRAITSTGTESIQIGDAGVNDIRFKNASGSVARMLANGNVGIGTTSPGVKLEVSGDHIRLSDAYSLQWVNANNRIYNQSSATVFVNNASESMRITSAGKIGIGTTNPSQLFEINGGSGQLITTDSHQRLFITSSPNHQAILYFGDTGLSSQGRVAYDNNYDDMYFNTAGAEKMRIKSNGNVGIGTSSPTQALHLPDNKQIALGTGADLKIQHNGTNSEIGNFTGSLNIYTHTDDGDINFQADNGSGGIETYFFLDGSNNFTVY